MRLSVPKRRQDAQRLAPTVVGYKRMRLGKTVLLSGLAVDTVTGAGYALWKRAQRAAQPLIAIPANQARRLLERAAPLMHLPTSPKRPPEALSDGSGLHCPVSERVFSYQNGVLDLQDAGLKKTLTQYTLDTAFTAWAYDRFRGWLTRALNSPDFPVEVAHQIGGADLTSPQHSCESPSYCVATAVCRHRGSRIRSGLSGAIRRN